MSLHVEIDVALDHQRVERLLAVHADIRRGPGVPRSMETDDHPRRLFAVDRGEIVLEPVVLLARGSKGAVVRAGVGASSFVWCLQAGREIGFAIKNDKVGEAVVEGVPKVAQATGFVRGHAEVVDCGAEENLFTKRAEGDG